MTTTFGRYTLHEPIGRGGMAEVWRATLDGPMGYAKEVALKRIPRAVVSEKSHIEALVNEARIGGKLRHPNLVEIYELVHEEEEWFVTMELVRGTTLDRVLDRCRENDVVIPWPVAVEIGQQVLTGLQYAHSTPRPDGQPGDVIHRDIKPANIILSDDGQAKILDFGIARSSMAYFQSITGQVLKGSPVYMSPEQVSQEHLTPASDLFSFGVVLVELLTNEQLFRASGVFDVFARVLNLDLAPCVENIRSIHPALGVAVERCLDRDPEARGVSASSLPGLLARARGDGPNPVTLAEFVDFLRQGTDRQRNVSPGRPTLEIAASLEDFGSRYFDDEPADDVDDEPTQTWEPETTSVSRGRMGWPRIAAISAVALVAISAVALMAVVAVIGPSATGGGTTPDEAYDQFVAAVALGDPEAAGHALSSMERGAEQSPGGALLLATNAALAGEPELAASLLVGAEQWPEPQRSRALALRDGLGRLSEKGGGP